MKSFASIVTTPRSGQTFSLRQHPLQGFQWGDYSAKPRRDYTYRVVALGGVPGNMAELAFVEVRVQTEDPDEGTHGVWFNRGVAASQAYKARFGGPPPKDAPIDDPRMVWLSRGLAESFLELVARADGSKWGLKGAFYEFTWKDGLKALRAAHLRGADVKLVVHGRDKDTARSGDKDTTAEDNEDAARKARIYGLVDWRTAKNKSALQHNKFLVLLYEDKPVAVWTGSTNLTLGGIYGQSNVAHVIRDEAIARSYVAYWEELKGPSTTADLRVWIEAKNAVELSHGPQLGMTTVFSPRDTDSSLLEDYANIFDSAKSSAHITGAFGLNEVFRTKLKADKGTPRTVLLDKPSSNIPRTDRDVRISSGARIARDDLGQWAEESLTGFNYWVQYVHLKIILVDPLTNDPKVLTGSANYSAASTISNEENTLVVSGDTRVADMYITEYQRLFMHYTFRRWAEVATEQPSRLLENDAWVNDYYDKNHWRYRQRLLFAGT